MKKAVSLANLINPSFCCNRQKKNPNMVPNTTPEDVIKTHTIKKIFCRSIIFNPKTSKIYKSFFFSINRRTKLEIKLNIDINRINVKMI